jgi:DNA-binding transcriptional regulator YiaG
MLGVSLDTYRFWETGRTAPQAASWPLIIQFLGYDPYPPLRFLRC